MLARYFVSPLFLVRVIKFHIYLRQKIGKMLPCQILVCEEYCILDEDYFSAEAAAILEELTQGKMLQAQVVGRSEEGIPYVHIYQINGEKVMSHYVLLCCCSPL